MSYKTFVSINIAIIGNSEIAQLYALAFAQAGHEVFIAWKEGERSNLRQVMHMIDRINVCSIEDAAALSDLIIIATPPEDVREVAYWLGDVRRKVIIDATSNVRSNAGDRVRTSSAIKSITGSDHVVKAFHTKGYEKILRPLFDGKKVELLLVGNSKKAKEVTKILMQNLGISKFLDFGQDEQIPLFNSMINCWRELKENNPGADSVQKTVKRR